MIQSLDGKIFQAALPCFSPFRFRVSLQPIHGDDCDGDGDEWWSQMNSGWWYTYPSEKYESVGMIIPNIYIYNYIYNYIYILYNIYIIIYIYIYCTFW